MHRQSKYFVRKTPGVQVFRDGREICTDTAAGKREYFRRTRKMSERQNERCAICGLFMVDPTFDHENGRGFNGGARNDAMVDKDGNWINAAVHWMCNGKKGSKRYHWVGRKYLPVDQEAA